MAKSNKTISKELENVKKKSVNKIRKQQNQKQNPKKNEVELKSHPDHKKHIVRLNRVKGQIEGIERMINDSRYCPDIMAQLKAASSALNSIEAEIFKTHIKSCVKQAFLIGDSFKIEEKIQEIVKLVY